MKTYWIYWDENARCPQETKKTLKICTYVASRTFRIQRLLIIFDSHLYFATIFKKAKYFPKIFWKF